MSENKEKLEHILMKSFKTKTIQNQSIKNVSNKVHIALNKKTISMYQKMRLYD